MRALSAVAAIILITGAGAAPAQDANITLPVPELERMLALDPFTIVSAEISRPKAKGDITLRAEVSFDGRPPMRVKLRKAEPGADTFNNQPRYDLAAYRLQAFFLDPTEYVVPPTAVRFLPLREFDKYSPGVKRTFSGADEALAVLQYWLQDVKVIADVYRSHALCYGPGLRTLGGPDERPHLSHRAWRLQRRQFPDFTVGERSPRLCGGQWSRVRRRLKATEDGSGRKYASTACPPPRSSGCAP